MQKLQTPITQVRQSSLLDRSER